MGNPNFESTKICRVCGERKPATFEYFGRQGKKLNARCKDCTAEYQKPYRDQNKEKIAEVKKSYREANKKRIAETKKSYYQANREKIAEDAKVYREANKESISERGKAYYVANKEKIDEYQKSYQDANKERIAEYKKTYSKLNPDKVRAIEHNYRARKQGLPNALTTAQVESVLAYFNHSCAACGKPFDMLVKMELDHWVPISSPDCPGTTATNIIPLCGGNREIVGHISCNKSKSSRDAKTWLVRRFGEQEGNRILERINAYFRSLPADVS